MCTRSALPQILKEFAAKDPLEMAVRSGAVFQENELILNYCNHPLRITFPYGGMDWQRTGSDDEPPWSITHEERVVILKYLATAVGLPARGQWVSFHELKGGPLHWKPFNREALEPLAHGYHHRRELFLDLGKKHGGTHFGQGDAGLIIPVLPQIKLAFVLWKGGEEFAPRSTILFDTVAEAYFPTAVLYILAIQAVIRIWFPGDTRFD